MDGSTLPAVKRALVAALQARPALSDVAIGYQAVTDGVNLSSDSGVLDAIWLHDAEITFDIPFFKALPLVYDEHIDLSVMVQSIRKESDGTQQVVDQRCSELLAEIIGTIATDPTLGITDYLRCEITAADATHVPGAFGPGHGARYELTLRVEGRLQLS